MSVLCGSAFAALLFLLPAAISADQTTPVLLTLGNDFQLRDLEPLPRQPAAHLHITRQDYPDFSAAEWQIRLQPAPADPASSGNISQGNLHSAAFDLQFPGEQPVTLHWNRGSQATPADFEPMAQTLAQGDRVHLQSSGGRSSDGVMPYFNLATPDGGLIFAVGWAGNWQAAFQQIAPSRIRIQAGLQHDNIARPEDASLRLPAVLILSYRGSWHQGQNQFRRFMRRHLTPDNHPELQLMPVAASVHGMIGFNDTTETKLTQLAAHVGQLGLALDTFWLDAGWNVGGFPAGQGNPEPDSDRFPSGLTPVGQAATDAGLRFLMWFEPERVMRGTWLDREHSDWLLSPSSTPEHLRYLELDGFRLLDLGNPQALAWAVEDASARIRGSGIDIYRQDFNAPAEYFWHTQRTASAAALCEVRYINGLYDFLDQLQQRHPQLIIDNCASGGRRMDFEMLRRTVVLWRSDSCWDDAAYPRNVQAMTHGLSHWIPLHGLGAAAADVTSLRSGMGACATYALPWYDDSAVKTLRNHLQNYLPVRRLFMEDFYPLTRWTIQPHEWLAFQFHDPAANQGIVQAFCDADAGAVQPTLSLHALKPGDMYRVTDWDHPDEEYTVSGSELMTSGLPIRSLPASHCLVIEYRPATPDK